MVFIVMSTYPLDSLGVVKMISLLSCKIGNANNSPVINCELTFPGIKNLPGFNLPSTEKGNAPL